MICDNCNRIVKFRMKVEVEEGENKYDAQRYWCKYCVGRELRIAYM